jgi:hypothetical protein
MQKWRRQSGGGWLRGIGAALDGEVGTRNEDGQGATTRTWGA